MVKYVKDTEGFCKKALEDLRTRGLIKFSYIESVKLRNPITQKYYTIKDIYMVSTGENSNKPWVIVGVRKSSYEKCKVLHPDITHMNISGGIDTYNLGDYILYYRSFCNPVLQHHIWDRPDDMSKILKGNLLEGNPNDRWRPIDSVDGECHFPRMCKPNGDLQKDTATLRQLVTGKDNPSEETREQTKGYKAIAEELCENHDLCYGYVIYGDNVGLKSWKVIPKSDLQRDDVWTSNYYRTYDYSNIDEIPVIEKENIDVGVFGCGSAGSNIVEQLKRLTYFNSMVLVDPDYVESKNIRNQAYNERAIGSYKADCLRNIVCNCHEVNRINCRRYVKKFQNEEELLECKFNIVVSGFDSFEARLLLLDYIKSGKIETKYLIDTRYDDLTSSLFFIDVENSKELEYYENVLKADAEAYEEYNNKKLLEKAQGITEWTNDMADDLIAYYQVCNGGCSELRRQLGLPDSCGTESPCGTVGCTAYWRQMLNEHKVPFTEWAKISGGSNSCLAQNLIHIYTYTSSWVTAGIRSIYSDNGKPYTHIELGIDPIPVSMVVRR